MEVSARKDMLLFDIAQCDLASRQALCKWFAEAADDINKSHSGMYSVTSYFSVLIRRVETKTVSRKVTVVIFG